MRRRPETTERTRGATSSIVIIENRRILRSVNGELIRIAAEISAEPVATAGDSKERFQTALLGVIKSLDGLR